MRKSLAALDAGITSVKKNLRARANVMLRREAIERYYRELFPIPRTLYVETTNVCNARCVFCYYPKIADTHPRRYMDPAGFERILREFAAEGGREVGLTPTLGDPLIDPHFPARIAAIERSGIESAFFYTNLIHVSSKIEQALRSISRFTLRMNVSVAGFDKPAYARLMGVDRFDAMVANLDRLAAIARANPHVRPNVRLQDYDGSAPAKKEFVARLERLGVGCTVNTLVDTWGGLVEAEIDGFAELQKRPRLARIGPCKISYLKPLVSVDLKLKLCDCRDVRNELVVGDLAQGGLRALWTGERAGQLRASMYDPATMPEICRKCEMYISIFDHKG